MRGSWALIWPAITSDNIYYVHLTAWDLPADPVFQGLGTPPLLDWEKQYVIYEPKLRYEHNTVRYYQKMTYKVRALRDALKRLWIFSGFR